MAAAPAAAANRMVCWAPLLLWALLLLSDSATALNNGQAKTRE
jgi:hypothetical protein